MNSLNSAQIYGGIPGAIYKMPQKETRNESEKTFLGDLWREFILNLNSKNSSNLGILKESSKKKTKSEEISKLVPTCVCLRMNSRMNFKRNFWRNI